MIKKIYLQAREKVRENAFEKQEITITIPSICSLFHRQLRAPTKAYSIPKKRTPLKKTCKSSNGQSNALR